MLFLFYPTDTAKNEFAMSPEYRSPPFVSNPYTAEVIYCNFLDFSLAASALACLANLAFFL